MTETESLIDEFRDSAEKLQEAFPEKLDRLVVLVDTSTTPVYLSPDIAAPLSRDTHAIQKALDEAFNAPNIGGAADHAYPMGNYIVKAIAIKENVPGNYSPQYTQKMDRIYFFDHEMAHLIGKNAMSGHYGECFADAYAMLRHIQRFGRETGVFEYNNTAEFVVLGNTPIHYTDTIMQRVKQLSAETKGIAGKDIANLSLQKTADLAEEIAFQYQVKEKILEKISEAFSPVKEASRDRKSLTDICTLVLSIMKEHNNDPDIFNAGKQFLNSPSIKGYVMLLAKEDSGWNAALNLIAQPVLVRENSKDRKPSGISPV